MRRPSDCRPVAPPSGWRFDFLDALGTGLLRGLAAMIAGAGRPRRSELLDKPPSLLADLGLSRADIERLEGADLERRRAWERLRHLR